MVAGARHPSRRGVRNRRGAHAPACRQWFGDCRRGLRTGGGHAVSAAPRPLR